jgi:NADH-quinone oxidoreductase subunit A
VAWPALSRWLGHKEYFFEGGTLAQYLPVLVMAVLATLFAAGSFVASAIFAPKRPTKAKGAPYECGIVPRNAAAERFPVRFYLVAMIFIVFDIEIVFLYPWAADFRQLAAFGFAEVVVFAVIVFASFVYLIGNGALNWGPQKRVEPQVDLDVSNEDSLGSSSSGVRAA